MPKKNCIESALDCLSRRAFAVKELEGKLKDKGYQNTEIADTLNRIEEMGYLNDLDFAQNCIRFNLNRWGKKRIEQDLYKRGVTRDTVSDAFYEFQEKEGFTDYNWREKAVKTLLMRFKGFPKQLNGTSESIADKFKEQEKEKNKRLRFLISRGYSIDEAMYALEQSKKTEC